MTLLTDVSKKINTAVTKIEHNKNTTYLHTATQGDIQMESKIYCPLLFHLTQPK